MKNTSTGWVVITKNHPNSNRSFIIETTFARTRTESKKLFTKSSGETWKYWYQNYNFRCVKAESTITIKEEQK